MRAGLLAAVCTAALMAGGCVTDDERPAVSLRPGDRVPAFEVTMADGSRYDSSTGGAAGVIVFFNTGCADCRRELPEVQAAYWECAADVEAGRIRFVCIAREEGHAEIETYWRAAGLTLPWAAQESREVYGLFADRGIPRIYVTTPAGIIFAAYDDADSPAAAEIASAAREAATQPRPDAGG